MDRQRTEGPSTLLERAGLAAGAGAGGAALAAAGSYGAFYGLASQAYGFVGSGASGTMRVLSYLLFAVAMSVGGGTLLSRALGVSTWWRSTLISAAAHAIGIPLWIVAWNNLTSYPEPHGVFSEQPLLSFSAATYAFVVPLVVVFSSFRENALGGWAVTIALSAATAALPATAVLVDSEELAVTSGVVAWVVLPAVSVLGSAMIGPRNR